METDIYCKFAKILKKTGYYKAKDKIGMPRRTFYAWVCQERMPRTVNKLDLILNKLGYELVIRKKSNTTTKEN